MNILIKLVILSYLFLTACGKKNSEVESKAPVEQNQNTVTISKEQYENANIQLGKIEYKNISESLIVNGLLGVPPQNLVSISVPLGGFLKSTELLQGMKVRKGQLIAIIENIEFITLQQEFLDTKNKLEFMSLEFKRQEDLSKQNINSPRDFQQSQSDFKSLKSKFNGLKEKLEVIGVNSSKLTEENISKTVSIYSPINGFVTNIFTNVGKFVNPVDVLFDIVNTEHIHAELTVFEKDITKIKKGQKVKFTLANEENRTRSAKVFLIGREISPDRTIRVHAHLDKEDIELLPKMYIKAIVELGAVKQIVVPNEAIIQDGETEFIFVLDTLSSKEVYKFNKLFLNKGVSENGYTGIQFSESINLSKIVIVKNGAYALISKLKNTEE